MDRFHTHNLTISKRGLDFIKRREELRLTSYQDIGGVWTMGYGHTGSVLAKQTISITQAESLLRQDIGWAEHAIRTLVTSPLSQNEYDALVSLVFNIGQHNFAKSTVLKKLHVMDYEGAADAFLMWDKVDGKVSKGLMNRRRDERLFFSGQGGQ